MFNAPKCPHPRCDGQGKPLEADLWKALSGYPANFLQHHVQDDRKRFDVPIMEPVRVAVWFCPYCGHVEHPEDLAAWAYDFASTQFALKLEGAHRSLKRLKLSLFRRKDHGWNGWKKMT